MSQYADILNHCRAGNSITSMIAMQRYGICRLSERCRELEQRGHKFSREVITIINRHGHKCKFTAYSLDEPQPEDKFNPSFKHIGEAVARFLESHV